MYQQKNLGLVYLEIIYFNVSTTFSGVVAQAWAEASTSFNG